MIYGNRNRNWLVQDKYLRNLKSYDNLGQIFWQENLDKSNHENLQQISRKTISNQMQTLRREIEFLERGMQRVKTRLCKILQEPLLTLATSLSDIKPKQLIRPEYHDYPEYDQYTEPMIQEHDVQTGPNDLIYNN